MVHGKIESQIRKAKALYASHGEAMALDPAIRSLATAYRQAIAKTAESMRRLGVPTACGACAEKTPGGCCFREIEETYDHILLLANLLMGCGLPESAEVPAGCYFLGSKGCKLTARYYFCSQYFCPDLESLLGKTKIQSILETLGQELTIGLELEQAIRNWLSTYTT